MDLQDRPFVRPYASFMALHLASSNIHASASTVRTWKNPSTPAVQRVKWALILLGMLPLARLVAGYFTDQLGANPIELITRSTGTWTLVGLAVTLSIDVLKLSLGLEPIAKFIEVSSDGKTTAQIPYWGIHPKESLRTSIDNVTANVGILLGQIDRRSQALLRMNPPVGNLCRRLTVATHLDKLGDRLQSRSR